MPFQIIAANKLFFVRKNAIIFAWECTFWSPYISQITFHFDIFILHNIRFTGSDNYFVFQIADMLNGVIFLIYNLRYEWMLSFGKYEMVFFAEKRF